MRIEQVDAVEVQLGEVAVGGGEAAFEGGPELLGFDAQPSFGEVGKGRRVSLAGGKGFQEQAAGYAQGPGG